MAERRRLWRTVYVVVAVLASLVLLLYAIPEAQTRLRGFPYDGWVDWLGARAYVTHSNPYDVPWQQSAGLGALGFGHPPTTPFWFLTFAQTEVQMMSLIVGQFTTLMLLGAALMVTRLLALPMPAVTGVLVFSATMATSWMLDHLAMAQISMLIAFLYLLAWVSLRHGLEVPAGIFLGLACTLKLFPGIMVGLLLLTRRWRGFIAACVPYLIIAGIMTARYGARCWLQFFQQQGPTADFWSANVRNGSLHGIVLRLARPACTMGGPTSGFTTVATAVVAIALLFVCWRVSRASLRQAQSLDLGFMLFAVVSAFLNPWLWEHYNVFLIAPFLLCLTTLFAERRRGLSLRWFAGGAVALGFTVVALSMDMSTKSFLQTTYLTNKTSHFSLHVYEILNWAPWAVIIAFLLLLHLRANRLGRVSGAA